MPISNSFQKAKSGMYHASRRISHLLARFFSCSPEDLTYLVWKILSRVCKPIISGKLVNIALDNLSKDAVIVSLSPDGNNAAWRLNTQYVFSPLLIASGDQAPYSMSYSVSKVVWKKSIAVVRTDEHYLTKNVIFLLFFV